MSIAKRNFLSELEGIDWDFTGERANGGSGASHWYPARFVPQVPGILVGFLSEPGDTVLDPFCGSGTSLVEALRLGRSAIGVDTNPVAVLITRARTMSIEPSVLEREATLLRDRVGKSLVWGKDDLHIPNAEENRYWYHEETLHELAAIWNAFDEGSDFTLVAQAVFSGLLKQVCSQDKHWGWICDNVRPKELRYKPVVYTYFQRLESHLRELIQLEMNESASPALVNRSVFKGASRDVLRQLPGATVDAVVTSPPYFGMTDYVRSQRLSYLWFDWPFEEDRSLETGARYKRRRKTAHQEFMWELRDTFTEVSRVLKYGGMCALVAGESPSRQPYLEDLRALLSEECSLEIETVLHRSVARQRALSSLDQTEQIIVARRC